MAYSIFFQKKRHVEIFFEGKNFVTNKKTKILKSKTLKIILSHEKNHFYVGKNFSFFTQTQRPRFEPSTFRFKK